MDGDTLLVVLSHLRAAELSVVSQCCRRLRGLAEVSAKATAVLWAQREQSSLGHRRRRHDESWQQFLWVLERTSTSGGGVQRSLVATGSGHTAVIHRGQVFACGRGGNGQLGDRTHTCAGHDMCPLEDFAPTLQPMTQPDGTHFVHVCASDTMTGALSRDGRVFTWGCGSNVPSMYELPTACRAVQLAVGENHCACVDASGLLWTWGCGLHGQLGHADASSTAAPRRVMTFRSKAELPAETDQWTRVGGAKLGFYIGGPLPKPPAGQQEPQQNCDRLVRSVACAGDQCAAIDNNGHLWSWGRGWLGHGQFSLSEVIPRRVVVGSALACLRSQYHSSPPECPAAITVAQAIAELEQREGLAAQEAEFSQVSCGAAHSAALSPDGTLFTWGWHRRPAPTEEEEEEEEEGHAAVTDNSHRAPYDEASWGERLSLLGHPVGALSEQHEQRPSPVAALIALGIGAAHVQCGASVTSVVDLDGVVHTFGSLQAPREQQQGRTEQGQETETVGSSVPPWAVVADHRSSRWGRVLDLACSAEHAVVRTGSGELYSWGAGAWGKLGRGDQRDASAPTLLPVPPPPEEGSAARDLARSS